MRLSRVFFIGLVLILFPNLNAKAEVPTDFDFHPMSKMTLARGLDPNNLAVAKSICIGSKINDADAAHALDGDIGINYVTQASNIREALHVDASIDASYLSFSGSANFNFDHNFDRDERSVSIVVVARSEYSRRETVSVTLTNRAQSMLDSKDYPSFISECGSYYVALERRGVMLGAVITIRDASEKARNAIHAEMAAKGGYGPMTGGAKASFSHEMEAATNDHRVDVQVTYNGGPGLAALADLVKSTIRTTTNVDDIGAALADYLRKVDKENAAPVGYSVVRYPGLPEDITDLQFEQKQKALATIVAEYRHLEKLSNDIATITSGDDARSKYFTPSQIADFGRHKAEIDGYMNKLRDAHLNCKNARKSSDEISSACGLPENEPQFGFLDLPPPNAVPVISFRGVVGQNYDNELLSELDSDTFLKGFGSSNLLARARYIKPTATYAAVAAKIDSYYLDGYRIFYKPSDEIAKKFIDRVKEGDLITKTRLQLPKFKKKFAKEDITEPSYEGAEGLYIRKDETVVILIEDSEPSAFSFIPSPDVAFLAYRQINFPAIVIGIAAALNEPKGHVDIFLEARDIFDNRSRAKLFQLEWWDFKPSTYEATMRIIHESGLPDEILPVKGESPAECRKRMPERFCPKG